MKSTPPHLIPDQMKQDQPANQQEHADTNDEGTDTSPEHTHDVS